MTEITPLVATALDDYARATEPSNAALAQARAAFDVLRTAALATVRERLAAALTAALATVRERLAADADAWFDADERMRAIGTQFEAAIAAAYYAAIAGPMAAYDAAIGPGPAGEDAPA